METSRKKSVGTLNTEILEVVAGVLISQGQRIQELERAMKVILSDGQTGTLTRGFAPTPQVTSTVSSPPSVPSILNIRISFGEEADTNSEDGIL